MDLLHFVTVSVFAYVGAIGLVVIYFEMFGDE